MIFSTLFYLTCVKHVILAARTQLGGFNKLESFLQNKNNSHMTRATYIRNGIRATGSDVQWNHTLDAGIVPYTRHDYRVELVEVPRSIDLGNESSAKAQVVEHLKRHFASEDYCHCVYMTAKNGTRTGCDCAGKWMVLPSVLSDIENRQKKFNRNLTLMHGATPLGSTCAPDSAKVVVLNVTMIDAITVLPQLAFPKTEFGKAAATTQSRKSTAAYKEVLACRQKWFYDTNRKYNVQSESPKALRKICERVRMQAEHADLLGCMPKLSLPLRPIVDLGPVRCLCITSQPH